MSTKEIKKRATEKNMTVKKLANIIARNAGWNRATEIKSGLGTKILDTVAHGYRKFTTGEYVPSSYRSNFGWKNTYYQAAECVVQIDYRIHKTLPAGE